MNPRHARIMLTGATGGIGSACAHALVQSGAAVMLAGRSPARLAALARSLWPDADASRVDWHAADLSQPGGCESLARAAAQFECNAVVHAAGMPSFGRIESFSAGAIEASLQLNLLAPVLLTQALLPHLRTRPEARIVFVGSALGRIGLPGFSVYSAAKFGLRGFAEALRRELGDGALRVQYLGPRSTVTGFNSDAVARYNAATHTAMDAPETVARALLGLLESGAAERFIGFPERIGVRLNGLAPELLDGTFRKHRESLPPEPASASSRPFTGAPLPSASSQELS